MTPHHGLCEALPVNGCDAFVAALKARNVEVVWGLPGAHNLPAWKALAKSDIRLITFRHEQGAGFAADAYSRATNRVGVVLVTTGPGATNALTAVGEAFASSASLLLIATEVATSASDDGVNHGALHQSAAQDVVFSPLTKTQLRVTSPEQLGQIVASALDECEIAPARPVYLEVPTDMWLAPSREAAVRLPQARTGSRVLGDLDAVAEHLGRTTNPLVWVGAGGVRADAGDEVGALASRLGAPVLTTYRARGLVPPDHPCYVGFAPHFPEVGSLWDRADCVVSIGSDLDGMMTQDWRMPPPASLVAINVDPADATKNYDATWTLEGDAKLVVRELLERMPQGMAPGLAELRQQLDAVRAQTRTALRSLSPISASFLEMLDQIIQENDAAVVADMCIAGYWAAAALTVRSPFKFAYPVGWGTLGYAPAASLGMAIATGLPTLCIVGDGGLVMSCGDLATVAEERPPITFLVVDNGGYGMLRSEASEFRLFTPNLAELFGAFDIPCVGPVTEIEDLGRELRAALLARRPAAVHVRMELPAPPTTTPHWYRKTKE